MLGEDKAVSSPRPPFSRQPLWDAHPVLQDSALPLSGCCLRRKNSQPRGGPCSIQTGTQTPSLELWEPKQGRACPGGHRPVSVLRDTQGIGVLSGSSASECESEVHGGTKGREAAPTQVPS